MVKSVFCVVSNPLFIISFYETAELSCPAKKGVVMESTTSVALVSRYRHHDQDDTSLILLARRGNREVLGMLLERHRNKVFYICLKLLAHREDAEDCVQETFTKALLKFNTFRGDAEFGTWLYRIAINESLMKLRGVPRRREVSCDDMIDSGRNDHALELVPLRVDIANALDHLDPQQRIILKLRFWEDCLNKDIPLDCGGGSESKLKAQARKAYAELRELLDAPLSGSTISVHA